MNLFPLIFQQPNGVLIKINYFEQILALYTTKKKKKTQAENNKKKHLGIGEIAGKARAAGLAEAANDVVHLGLHGAPLIHQSHRLRFQVRRHHSLC